MTSGFSLDISEDTMATMLEEAIEDHDEEYYLTLVARGADPTYRRWITEESFHPDEADREVQVESLLNRAARHGCARAVEHMLSLGMNVNFADNYTTPLLAWAMASEEKHPNCNMRLTGEILLRAGADPDFARLPQYDVYGERQAGRSARWFASQPSSANWLGETLRWYDTEMVRQELDADTPLVSKPGRASRL